MRIVKTVRAMQAQARQCRRADVAVGFVPTMGSLHSGHVSLIRRARKLVGGQGLVVASIYVNPTQFGPREDFAKYPRDLQRDARLCRAAGVDVIFAPSDDEMYNSPPAAFSTYVMEERLSRPMEGTARPMHFRGVTTVVAKLLNIVDPDLAVFGAKDFQQASVVKRMVRDLNFRCRIVVAPTVREADGLAMSSRNQYLSESQRAQAPALFRAIQLARQCVRSGPRGMSAAHLEARLRKFLDKQPEAQVDYISFFDPESLDPVDPVKAGAQLALAVKLGKTRLIDNGRL